MENLLLVNPEKILGRLEHWKNRNQDVLNFYQSIVQNKVLNEGETISAQKLLEDKSFATWRLKEFVLSKTAQTYLYWSKQEEIFQALYVMETILYSEVGLIDGNSGSDRKEILKIIMNRLNHKKYNSLDEFDDVLTYIKQLTTNIDFPWLNVLFKEGEFSFTYFYISGNLHIYCPDMGRTGNFLRRQNLKFSLDALKKPDPLYQGLRYYSRYSMQGRIEMDSIWNEYRPLKEKPGSLHPHRKLLWKKFKKNQATYLYEFVAEDGGDYVVVDIGHKNYVYKKNNPKEFFYYRNIHQFKYFGPKSL